MSLPLRPPETSETTAAGIRNAGEAIPIMITKENPNSRMDTGVAIAIVKITGSPSFILHHLLNQERPSEWKYHHHGLRIVVLSAHEMLLVQPQSNPATSAIEKQDNHENIPRHALHKIQKPHRIQPYNLSRFKPDFVESHSRGCTAEDGEIRAA